MKYFTEEMWSGINSFYGVEKSKYYNDLWEKNAKEYYKILSTIAHRLNKDVYRRFSQGCFHDYRLEKMELIHNEYGKTPVLQVRLLITDRVERFEVCFKNVKKFEVLSVENEKHNRGLDDWGYEEILPVDEKTLSLEVLFASGATVFIVFPNKELSIKKLK